MRDVVFDLRSAEVELRSALRSVERHTTFAEALAQGSTGTTVRTSHAGSSGEFAPGLRGAALRAWAGNHWVEVAASALTPQALTEAAASLNDRLSKTPAGPAPPGPPATLHREEVHPPARPLSDLSVEEAIARVQEYRGWALAVPGITEAHAFLITEEDARLYVNTAGAFEFQVLPRVAAAVAPVTVENGRVGQNWIRLGGMGGEEILQPITEARVRAVAEGAKAMLGAKSPPAGPRTVVLDPSTAGVLAHESFGHGTEADQFIRKRSYLQPLYGKMVGPEMLSIVDEGSFPGGWGSLFFDDEGTPTRRNLLVDHGRFVGVLHDRVTAGQLGGQPTGNARRSDFLSRLWVRMTNTYVEPGELSREELLAEARDGILLEEPTSGLEDPLGGQMQIKVLRGYRIERGKTTQLVSGIALSGRVLDVLRAVRGVSRVDRLVMDGAAYCGKGQGDYIPAGSGGGYVLTEAIVGPA